MSTEKVNPYDNWKFRLCLTGTAAITAGMIVHPIDTMKIRM